MRLTAFAFLILTLIACKPSGKERSRGIDDIENAIRIIESRNVAEQGIIEAHKYEIEILESNINKVSSEGMREKLRAEIEMKKLGIQKANRNMANQDTVLEQLRLKRDSINGLGN